MFQDNFESGGSNWTLNSGSGDNIWIINNKYTGLAPFIVDTPNQPAGISGSPNSNFLHIHNTQIAIAGVLNANFDTGSTSNQDAVMTNSISTVGKTNVTLTFWYLCAGETGVSEGKVLYSTDNGGTWNAIATYSNISTWTFTTISLPVFDNQANLKFKFNWVNGGSGSDPAFSVDDVLIVGNGGSNEIKDITLSDNTNWCKGLTKAMDVNFNAVGTFAAGNTFTAQLSDATGSFSTPTVIGSINSNTSGVQSISVSVPGIVPDGNGYRIRVVSSNPALVSTADNGTNLIIYPTPSVDLADFNVVCVYHSSFALSGGTPTGGTYSGNTVSSGIFNPTTAGVGNWPINYSYVDNNGCSNQIVKNLTVSGCASVSEVTQNTFSVYPNPATNKLYISGDNIKKVSIIDL